MNARLVVAAFLLVLTAAGGASCAQGKEGDAKGTGSVKHGWLGVSIQDVTPRLARERNLSTKTGALVTDVSEDSPAQRAGISEDDIIVAFNGKSVEESQDLLTAVRAAAPGEQASLTVVRSGEKKTMQLTVGKEPRRRVAYSFRGPGAVHIHPIPPFHFFGYRGMMGLSLSDLNRQLGEYFEAPGGRGVLVQEVEKGSSGEKAGFKAGDVIVAIGTQEVESTEDIEDALDGVKKGENVEFGILRKGAQKTLTVESEGTEGYRHGGFRSFEFHNDAFPEIERDALKREMDKMKEELRSIGTRIRTEMRDLERTLRSVTG